MEHYWFGWVTIPFGWILLHLSIFGSSKANSCVLKIVCVFSVTSLLGSRDEGCEGQAKKEKNSGRRDWREPKAGAEGRKDKKEKDAEREPRPRGRAKRDPRQGANPKRYRRAEAMSSDQGPRNASGGLNAAGLTSRPRFGAGATVDWGLPASKFVPVAADTHGTLRITVSLMLGISLGWGRLGYTLSGQTQQGAMLHSLQCLLPTWQLSQCMSWWFNRYLPELDVKSTTLEAWHRRQGLVLRSLGVALNGPARVVSVDMLDSNGRSTLNVRRLLRSAYHIQPCRTPPVTAARVALQPFEESIKLALMAYGVDANEREVPEVVVYQAAITPAAHICNPSWAADDPTGAAADMTPSRNMVDDCLSSGLRLQVSGGIAFKLGRQRARRVPSLLIWKSVWQSTTWSPATAPANFSQVRSLERVSTLQECRRSPVLFTTRCTLCAQGLQSHCPAKTMLPNTSGFARSEGLWCLQPADWWHWEGKWAHRLKGCSTSAFASRSRMLHHDGSLTLFGSFEEIALLDIEVPMIERAGFAAAVRADYLLAPALHLDFTENFQGRLTVVEPGGHAGRRKDYVTNLGSKSHDLTPEDTLHDSEGANPRWMNLQRVWSLDYRQGGRSERVRHLGRTLSRSIAWWLSSTDTIASSGFCRGVVKGLVPTHVPMVRWHQGQLTFDVIVAGPLPLPAFATTPCTYPKGWYSKSLFCGTCQERSHTRCLCTGFHAGR